jgi:hypothetical protein
MDDVKQQPAKFRKLLAESQTAGQELETALRAWIEAGQPAPPPKAIGTAFDRVSERCASCHRAHRDTPLREKSAK